MTIVKDAGRTNSGKITNNNGRLELNGVIFSNSHLKIDGNTAIDGTTGIIKMSNTYSIIRGVAVTDVLTLGSGSAAIRGAGQIGVNSMILHNNGTIVANQTNALTVDLSGAGTHNGTFKAIM